MVIVDDCVIIGIVHGIYWLMDGEWMVNGFNVVYYGYI